MAVTKPHSYRPALDWLAGYARGDDNFERLDVVQCVAFLFRYPAAKVADDLRRHVDRKQRDIDESFINPDDATVTARDEATRMTRSKEHRAHALADCGQHVLSFGQLGDLERVRYWAAVRRLVASRVEWRVAP